MNTTRKKASINGLFFVATLVVNALGATGVINGLSQKEISDRYLTLITPSPSTFSIWSVIYTLLLASVIVMIIRSDDSYYKRAVDEISTLFRISSLLNIVWIVTFSFLQIELSSLFIAAFAVTLSLICLKLIRIHDGKRWLLPLTFGMYTGWLFIATVVNIAAALVKLEWNGFGIAEELWAVIILSIAVVLIILVITQIRNAVFPLPVAWAYFGIYQYLNAPEGFKGEYGLLQTTALAGMAVLIGVAAIQLYRNHFSLIPKDAPQQTYSES
jgi:hypothetical protein